MNRVSRYPRGLARPARALVSLLVASVSIVVASSSPAEAAHEDFVIGPIESPLTLNVLGGTTDNGNKLGLWPDTPGAENQLFWFGDSHTFNGEVWTRLHVENSDKCLVVQNASTANGAKVVQWSCNPAGTAAHEYWRLELLTDTSFVLQNQRSGRCLNVPGGNYRAGVELIQWDCFWDASAHNELFARIPV